MTVNAMSLSTNAPTRLAALMPMKAHSERVPAKNFRRLAGKPLFRWMLDTLLSLEEVDRVIINTDARSQLEADGLTNEPRIVIRDRRPELCGDSVSMNLILADDIAATPADLYLMTHATNPLLSAETIRRALKALKTAAASGTADSLFAVTRHQSRFYDRSGQPINHDPDTLVRTQELEPLFEENSGLYLFTRQSFATTNARIGRRPIMFETPAIEALDIDEASDWDLVEAFATARRSHPDDPKAETWTS
jgi:CMP-N-acetylneuraminic acid synthetase